MKRRAQPPCQQVPVLLRLEQHDLPGEQDEAAAVQYAMAPRSVTRQP
jgi:hypothetical protein